MPALHTLARSLLLQAINKIDGPGGFTDEDIKTLTVVADTAGVTLQKARLLQVSSRRMQRGKRKRERERALQ